MNEQKLTKLLNDLADATVEPVRPGLTEDIKRQIPERLSPHKGGTDTIHIVINLRISKLAAAAVIIVTILLCAGLFGGRDWTSDGIVDGVRDSLAWLGAGRADVLAVRSKYEDLVRQGRHVVYYGDNIAPGDNSAILMQLKLPDGKYRIVFGDGSTRIVNAEELIELHSRMLLNKTR
ncbi:MAG: hypothetical protein OEW48_05255 [Phycisphaerae bacterium]|jgi:hypothetical protein|nr:hypothetical protein [Phycisphaerae bacterium]